MDESIGGLSDVELRTPRLPTEPAKKGLRPVEWVNLGAKPSQWRVVRFL